MVAAAGTTCSASAVGPCCSCTTGRSMVFSSRTVGTGSSLRALAIDWLYYAYSAAVFAGGMTLGAGGVTRRRWHKTAGDNEPNESAAPCTRWRFRRCIGSLIPFVWTMAPLGTSAAKRSTPN